MLRVDGDVVLVDVRVSPRAKRTAIAGERAGRLLIQTTAPPLDGRANDAVTRLLAKTLGVARGQVTISAGAHARDKVVRIAGLGIAEVTDRLPQT